MPRVMLLAVSVLASACAAREPLPTSHAEGASEAPPPDATDTLANDPIRLELRAIHDRCDGTVEALQLGVEDEERRENILTAVAALAYVLGSIGDRQSGAQGDQYGPDTNESCTETNHGRTREGRGCGFAPVPNRSLGEGGPVATQVDQTHADAGDQIRRINRALDAVDDLIFSAPDSSTWTDEERATWERLRAALMTACQN